MLALEQQHIKQKLLGGIWGFTQPDKVPPPKVAACLNHYRRLLQNPQLLNEQSTTLSVSATQSSNVIELVQILKDDPQTQISQIHEKIKADHPDWLVDNSHDVLNGMLQFGVQLWLFTKPDLSDPDITLQDAVRQPLKKGSPAYGALWRNFSAKSLKQKGHFHITPTSDIYEHLTFSSKSTVRVFAHASVLELFEAGSEGRIYPPGLLPEVRRTLNLLWPVENAKIAKHVYRLEKAQEIDIEVGTGHLEDYELRQYPYFGERLAKLQERLESEERGLANSRNFRIAVWGIVLTALFGLISAITGIMQVWASLK